MSKKENLLISFSGGRTSGYMLHYLLNSEEYKEKYNYKIVFANTGKEVAGTLDFVRNCAIAWDCEIIWIESRHKDENGNTFSPKGWKVGFDVVDYDTASRKGEPFEEMISVLGIPCSSAPFCSDQLKRKPIEAYLKSIGWKKFYKAIGIRSDEIDRVNPKYKEKRIVYPLVQSKPTMKPEILAWWKNESDFDLDIPKNLGNCDICWKKSFQVLTQNVKDHPERFKWWQSMIDKYKNTGRVVGDDVSFFRGGKSIEEIFKMSDLSSEEIKELTEKYKLDGCSESCEVYK